MGKIRLAYRIMCSKSYGSWECKMSVVEDVVFIDGDPIFFDIMLVITITR